MKTLRQGLFALTALTTFGLAAGAATADGFSYTGTTLGGPVWNRPIDNGSLAPDTLSGTGTAVPYQARTFTIGTTGVYDFVSAAGYDNYTFLYQGTFNATSPLINVLLGNDDNPDIGQSGLQSVPLTAGQAYTFVTTGFANTDAGAFSNSVAQEFTFQTGTTAGSPTWDPYGDGQAIHYSSFAFTVSTSGLYSIQSTAGFDNLTALYQDSFNPTDPNGNLLFVNDDNPDVGLSGFLGQQLTAGATYYYVTTGYDETQFGTFSNAYSGPGLLRAVVAPEPSQTAALGLGALGLAGAVLKARRRGAAIA